MNISINNADKSHTLNQSKIAFKGYDARSLSAVVMTVNDEPDSFEIIKQMSEIGKKEGFRVYFTNQTNKLYANLDSIKKFFKICTFGFAKWAQDMAVLTPENKVLQDSLRIDSDFARRVATLTKGKYTDCENYIEGGNLFFVLPESPRIEFPLPVVLGHIVILCTGADLNREEPEGLLRRAFPGKTTVAVDDDPLDFPGVERRKIQS